MFYAECGGRNKSTQNELVNLRSHRDFVAISVGKILDGININWANAEND